MIREIENRSAYLLAIKSNVEAQGELIGFLTREVERAAYEEIADVEVFVMWLDKELSYLVDERAVLKHFPSRLERKADAMREATVGYRELKHLEAEVVGFSDDRRQPTSIALKRMHALQDKLECGVQNIERVRESAGKRYQDFKIPWQWMLDFGIIAQLLREANEEDFFSLLRSSPSTLQSNFPSGDPQLDRDSGAVAAAVVGIGDSVDWRPVVAEQSQKLILRLANAGALEFMMAFAVEGSSPNLMSLSRVLNMDDVN